MLTSWLLAGSVWPSALAATRSYTLTLQNKVVSLDGFPRSAIAVNGMTPGPLLTAKPNDTLEVAFESLFIGPWLDHALQGPHTE
ncbi:hypothetical protein HGRIS_011259 [Hohenbuehelia grisea]|uniref:Uncharacterized protein n=1 Tax=Hohenbuehelia grisea TaxID=104357 RepID=A0ABR3JWG6_9AGAR